MRPPPGTSSDPQSDSWTACFYRMVSKPGEWVTPGAPADGLLLPDASSPAGVAQLLALPAPAAPAALAPPSPPPPPGPPPPAPAPAPPSARPLPAEPAPAVPAVDEAEEKRAQLRIKARARYARTKLAMPSKEERAEAEWHREERQRATSRGTSRTHRLRKRCRSEFHYPWVRPSR